MFRRPAPLATLAAAALTTLGATARPSPSIPSVSSVPSVAHVINRLTYGPRPGDLARVQRIGVAAWIDEQLHPERIADANLGVRLARFETLALDQDTIVKAYHQPAVQERRQRRREQPPMSSESEPNRLARPGADPRSEAQRKDRLVLAELSEARLLRALYSERQLEEVLTDFWFNHFNVFAGKGPTRAYLTAFERDAIRPHVLGSFRGMLEAVAASPAMLFYLDNWMNVAPGSRLGRGINENYARELLELHTMGVDGGYTQDDIVNVARAFTGWTISRVPGSRVPVRPRQEGAFVFAPALHDRSTKVVLGHTLTRGGVEEGRQVLDILVAHPATARFIAAKLARKFVSDTPPDALIERGARRFRETRGDLRELTRAIITAPEFLAPEAYGVKVKTPLEFVASALRATGADVGTALPVTRVLRDMGMPLYFCQPPTGYAESADTWVSSGALVARMNFALDLAAGRLRGIALPLTGISREAMRDRLIADALHGNISDSTRATVARAGGPGEVVALIIGSPEFQRQ